MAPNNMNLGKPTFNEKPSFDIDNLPDNLSFNTNQEIVEMFKILEERMVADEKKMNRYIGMLTKIDAIRNHIEAIRLRLTAEILRRDRLKALALLVGVIHGEPKERDIFSVTEADVEARYKEKKCLNT